MLDGYSHQPPVCSGPFIVAVHTSRHIPSTIVRTLNVRNMILACHPKTWNLRGRIRTTPSSSLYFAPMNSRMFLQASRCVDMRWSRMLCWAAVKTANREKTMPQYQHVRTIHGLSTPELRMVGQD